MESSSITMESSSSRWNHHWQKRNFKKKDIAKNDQQKQKLRKQDFISQPRYFLCEQTMPYRFTIPYLQF